MRRRASGAITRKMTAQYVSLVLPGMIVFTIGLILPMVLAVRFSLTSWNGMTAEQPFVALDNYARLFSDVYVRDAWWFTLRFTIWNTAVQNVLALLFALALDRAVRAKVVYRAVLFVPCLISAVVAGFVWTKVYANVLPAISELLGMNVNLRLFGNPKTVLSGLLAANNWQWVGYWMLIYLAGLQSIAPEYYEAARVDGASAIRQFLSITLPMLAPSFTVCVVGITTGSLKVYDLLVSSTGGGPGRASTSIILHIYNTAISGRQYGYGSAISITLVVVILLVAVGQVAVLRKREVQL